MIMIRQNPQAFQDKPLAGVKIGHRWLPPLLTYLTTTKNAWKSMSRGCTLNPSK